MTYKSKKQCPKNRHFAETEIEQVGMKIQNPPTCSKPIPKPKRKLPSAEGVPPPLPQRRAANPEREERGTLSEPDNANERPAETRVQRNLYNRFPE